MERNENEWNVSNLVWEQMEGMEWNHFITILLLDPYFKINSWIYRGILGILIKFSLNLNPFPPIPPNFEGTKIWDFEGLGGNEYSLLTIPFPST